MHLAATALTQFWDSSAENLFLGPWCARYDRKRDWENVRHRLLPDPWKDLARFERAVDDCNEFSERLMPLLAEYLNDALGVRHSALYWRLIVYPWLLYHMQQMHSHYIYLQDALSLDPGLTTTTMAPESYQTPRDIGDYVRLSMDDPYNLQLVSQLLAGRGYPTRRFEDWPRTQAPVGVNSPLKRRLKDGVSRLLVRLGALGAGRLLACDLHISRREYFRFLFAMRLRALPFFGTLPPELMAPPARDQRRLGLAGLAANSEFERLFVSSLPYNLPTLYLEGHEAARRRIVPLLWRPRAVFSGVGWHYNEPFKFAAAECAERGSRVWGLQHGGGYGQVIESAAEHIERAILDRFYTWGWSSLDGDAKLRDLPPPQLARVRRRGPGEGLLVVSMTMDLYNFRLLRDSNGDFASEYIERDVRLWNSLPAGLRRKAEMRLYKDYGWCQEARLRERCPDLVIDDRRLAFTDKLASSRLVIIDYPTTTIMEAFAADVPCLMTWNPKAFHFRDSAQPLYDELEKAGLLFYRPEEAAAQAARVFDDPLPWWNEPRRRRARLEFSRRFGRGSRDWLRDWVRELQRAD